MSAELRIYNYAIRRREEYPVLAKTAGGSSSPAGLSPIISVPGARGTVGRADRRYVYRPPPTGHECLRGQVTRKSIQAWPLAHRHPRVPEGLVAMPNARICDLGNVGRHGRRLRTRRPLSFTIPLSIHCLFQQKPRWRAAIRTGKKLA